MNDAAKIEVGAIFEGKVKAIKDFGIFVELAPGKDGLVHISKIAREKQATLSQDVKYGDVLKVKVIAVDDQRGRVSLVAPDLQ